MSFSVSFHGEADEVVEKALVEKFREFLSGLQALGSGEFHGEFTGATNLLNQPAAQEVQDASPEDSAPPVTP